MQTLSPKQQQKVLGVARHCEAYLRQRCAAAIRLKPGLAAALEQLVWLKMISVRATLERTRKFGGDIYLVTDILVSEDEEKRAFLLDTEGDLSLYHEIGAGDQKELPAHAADHGDIQSIPTCFYHIDPEYANVAELIGYWVWWDLPDAVDVHVIEQMLHRFDTLKTAPLSDQILDVYRGALQRGPDDVITRPDILIFECQKCQRLLDRFSERRDEEPAYRVIPAFEAPQTPRVDRLILETATHLTAVQRVEPSDHLDPRARAYYAETLGEDMDEITVDRVLKYEREESGRLKARLGDALRAAGAGEGDIYDFKRRQHRELRAKCDRNRAEIKKIMESGGGEPAPEKKPAESRPAPKRPDPSGGLRA